MLLRHPVLGIFHMLDGRRARSAITAPFGGQ